MTGLRGLRALRGGHSPPTGGSLLAIGLVFGPSAGRGPAEFGSPGCSVRPAQRAEISLKPKEPSSPRGPDPSCPRDGGLASRGVN